MKHLTLNVHHGLEAASQKYYRQIIVVFLKKGPQNNLTATRFMINEKELKFSIVIFFAIQYSSHLMCVTE